MFCSTVLVVLIFRRFVTNEKYRDSFLGGIMVGCCLLGFFQEVIGREEWLKWSEPWTFLEKPYSSIVILVVLVLYLAQLIFCLRREK